MNIALVIFGLVLLYAVLPLGGITVKETLTYGAIAGVIYLISPLLRGLFTRALGEATAGAEGLGKIIGAFLFLLWTALISLLFIGPILLLDSVVLLGPLSNFLWRHQPAIGVAVALSAIALSLLGGVTRETAKKLLSFAIILGIGIVVGSYVVDWYTATHRFIIKVENGGVYLDPFDSVQLKEGDKIRFAASGRYKGEVIDPTGKKTETFKKSPKGNITDIGDFVGLGESRPRGEMYFEINGNKIVLRNGQTKTVDFEGRVTIPAGVNGKLTVNFNDDPSLMKEGTMRLKLLINTKGIGEQLGDEISGDSAWATGLKMGWDIPIAIGGILLFFFIVNLGTRTLIGGGKK
ncbi:MAG: hypothetical protein A3A94_00900 [Candidatus Portnoybacteria bacterium RIFCSPLOWO2_01_FULL_43_11]|uniref:Uncharacterized protein n=4 Tax=Candidatus Portnoyibacteriota TaxID=1817913 RepID=A0A1G2FD14_9BACT|nr:MAG: hypothetical protein A2815_00515 [Candidatus Portnoybacteria bacterium RIFCSPHIGHO2_01_FULL_40_12b]OGZ36267.1 MAG: hypothetical protein A3D38_01190 [Candidatus Portnoybacteria bacterium RIFCSPHIGHO2_02_FULL_40_23]OGZ37738.1 MAG: hypothetical protein A3E90_02795 [Candidatus Portnoybacteria bacterium RIFCSPHIGHO2_12_FULL_40_11]OGZ38640.1 MAG: hypothetical protein A3A94_00900 [Candidatus Portnoybacteria bacterium RIFCSPLOWO2_01_FULL_43_11]OGZ40283.1 MAG: hypothetical protein A3I20_02125 [C